MHIVLSDNHLMPDHKKVLLLSKLKLNWIICAIF